MGTTKTEGNSFKRILCGLLILSFFGNQFVGAAPPPSKSKSSTPPGPKTVQEFFQRANTGATNKKDDLKCVICDSLVGKCGGGSVPKPVSCAENYLTNVYGKNSSALSSDTENVTSLNVWPRALSELAQEDDGESDKNAGWNLPGYPTRHKNSQHTIEGAHRFSSFAIAALEGNKNLDVQKYVSCYKMRVIVEQARNKDKGYEIAKEAPRYIRGCSFSNRKVITRQELFKKGGCKVINHKSSAVTICYCNNKAGCNSSTNLKVTQSMIAASVLLLFIRMF